MKYYVVADVHGYYYTLKNVLEEKGFFTDTEPHKLIILGDLFDRGSQTIQLQDFIVDLMEKDQVILIRGNHEDLFINLLFNMHKQSYNMGGHISNGTVDTLLHLSGYTYDDLGLKDREIYRAVKNSPFMTKIEPAMVNYFETENYIFVHGWIACNRRKITDIDYVYSPINDWRNATETEWQVARWVNGMEAHYQGVRADKTVVCGHWHCSYGHSKFENKGTDFGIGADFSPYYADGIIALDARTAYSNIINCIIIED